MAFRMREIIGLFILTGWLFSAAPASGLSLTRRSAAPAISAQGERKDKPSDDKKKEPRYIDKKPKDENRRDDDKQDDTKKKERRPQNDLCP